MGFRLFQFASVILLLALQGYGMSSTNLREIRNAIVEKVSCLECELFAKTLGLAVMERSEGLALEAFVFVCKVLKVEDASVCKGIVDSFGDELFRAIEMGVEVDTSLICWGLGVCSKPPRVPEWNVTSSFPKPKPPFKAPVAPSANDPFYWVLQLSDVHFDHLYQEGAVVNCGEPVCCRATSPSPTRNPPILAHKWGDYHCDLAPSMLDFVLETIFR